MGYCSYSEEKTNAMKRRESGIQRLPTRDTLVQPATLRLVQFFFREGNPTGSSTAGEKLCSVFARVSGHAAIAVCLVQPSDAHPGANRQTTRPIVIASNMTYA